MMQINLSEGVEVGLGVEGAGERPVNEAMDRNVFGSRLAFSK